MTYQHSERADLKAMLCEHHDEIATLWADQVRNLSSARYSQRKLRDLTDSALRGFTAICGAPGTSLPPDIEKCLTGVSEMRLQLELDIPKAIEALLLLKEVVLPIVRDNYSTSPAECYAAVAYLDACLRQVVGHLGTLYARTAETELRKSEERFRTVIDFAYDWQYWLGPEGNYVYVSPSCERITGYQPDEFRSDPELLGSIIHPQDRASVTEHLRSEPLEGGQAHLFEFRVLTRDGEERWLEHACQPVYGSDGTYLGKHASNRDITERRQAQEALAEQEREQTLAAERSRLARELHDSVTQALYSVNLYAEATRMAMSGGKQSVATDNLQELHRTVREAITDMRMLIFELHPPGLEKEGLVTALQIRLAAVEARAGLQTRVTVEDERRLPLAVEQELFWIAVEAFNNVIKHAQGSQVEIRLRFREKDVCLEIKDDGVGFDLDQARLSGGLGLQGMAERAERIHAELEITSASGQGTTVRVQTKV